MIYRKVFGYRFVLESEHKPEEYYVPPWEKCPTCECDPETKETSCLKCGKIIQQKS